MKIQYAVTQYMYLSVTHVDCVQKNYSALLMKGFRYPAIHGGKAEERAKPVCLSTSSLTCYL